MDSQKWLIKIAKYWEEDPHYKKEHTALLEAAAKLEVLSTENQELRNMSVAKVITVQREEIEELRAEIKALEHELHNA